MIQVKGTQVFQEIGNNNTEEWENGLSSHKKWKAGYRN